MPRKKVTDKQKESKVQSSGLAVTSLALSIFAVLFSWTIFLGPIFAVTAIIYGIVALANKENIAMSVTGLVLGSAVILFVMFLTIVGLIIAPPDPNFEYGPQQGLPIIEHRIIQ